MGTMGCYNFAYMKADPRTWISRMDTQRPLLCPRDSLLLTSYLGYMFLKFTLCTCMYSYQIGRVEKNSGGKGQAYYQPQVSAGKRQLGRLLVLGEYTHRTETSGISLVTTLSGQTQRHQH